jgi:hypothetical protein
MTNDLLIAQANLENIDNGSMDKINTSENSVSKKITTASVDNSAEGKHTFNYIDGYCERQSQPNFFAEPLNLITNLGFIIGAVLVFIFLKRNKMLIAKNFDILFLTFTLALIGVGSGAFHAIPNVITLNFDVIPIGIFIHFYLITFFIRILNLNLIKSILLVIAFIFAGYATGKYFSADTLNGTIMYVPTYFTLLIMIFVMFLKQNQLYLHLINTAIVWTFSLAARTVDMQLCPYTMNIGTHFIWHLLNAVVLYRLIMLVVLNKISHNKIK